MHSRRNRRGGLAAGPAGPGRGGFTLTEMLVVVVILMISLGVFYAIYTVNWSSLEQSVIRSNIWQDLNTIVEEVSRQVREARFVETAETADEKTLTLRDPDGDVIMEYRMSADGAFIADAGGAGAGAGAAVLTDRVNFAESDFEEAVRSLRLRVTLSDRFLNHVINVTAASEIYPRN